MQNTRISDLPYIHVMKTHIEILTGEVIYLRQDNKEQQKTFNIVDNFLDQLCNGNFRSNCILKVLTCTRGGKFMYNLQVQIEIIILFLSHLILQTVKHSKNPWSQISIFLLNPRTGQSQLGIFLNLNIWKISVQRFRKSVLWRKVINWFTRNMVVKKGTSGSLLFLALWSIRNFHPRSGSLLVLYINMGKIW